MDDMTTDGLPARPAPDSHAGATENAGISAARKVRFALLLVVLLAAVGLAAAVRAHHRREFARALADVRVALYKLDLEAAESALNRAKEMQPEDARPDSLAVALYYAGGNLEASLSIFSQLDLSGVVAQLDPDTVAAADEACLELGLSIEEEERTQIGAAGVGYLQDCGLLWNIASRVIRGAATDTDRALMLLDALTLATIPERDPILTDPQTVIWRGYGTPGQLAWTYAALAGQVDLPCRVAVLPAGEAEDYLVEVYPSGAQPFLVDPVRGVPVIDPASGDPLSFDAIRRDPSRYAALIALAGPEAARAAGDPGAAELKTVAHPYGYLKRFLVFEHLLSDLRVHPRLGFGPVPPGERAPLWDLPTANTLAPVSPEQTALLERTDRPFWIVNPGRRLQMQGLNKEADNAYVMIEVDLRRKLAEADVPDAVAVLTETLEHVAYFRALNAVEGGAYEGAELLLRNYMERYPTGRWSLSTSTLLAETLHRRSKHAEAAEIWRELSGPRALYGALRLRGMAAGAASAAPDPSDTYLQTE